MELSKVCNNPDCGCTFFKKPTCSLQNWQRQDYCTRPCQIFYKNKKHREKYKKVGLRQKHVKRIKNSPPPAKDAMIHFLSARLQEIKR